MNINNTDSNPRLSRQFNLLDKCLGCADNALRTLAASPKGSRLSPAKKIDNPLLSDGQRRTSGSLMRVNHTGEVCAQALYQGQSLTAKLPEVRLEMEQASAEEIDHLDWCATRLNELDTRTSIFNPFFYACSFTLGAVAGAIGDKYSLGFVAATEEQVCQHLKDHLQRLPQEDHKSRAIVQQMIVDEEAHGQAALEAGGISFPTPVKKAMSLISTVMTASTSRL